LIRLISMSDWDQYRKEQKERRETRLPVRQSEIESLSDLGYVVEKKTDFHYRINGTIDLWPIHNRWHNIKTGKRGGAKNLKEFIIKSLKQQ
jgi:hypothetical protein